MSYEYDRWSAMSTVVRWLGLGWICECEDEDRGEQAEDDQRREQVEPLKRIQRPVDREHQNRLDDTEGKEERAKPKNGQLAVQLCPPQLHCERQEEYRQDLRECDGGGRVHQDDRVARVNHPSHAIGCTTTRCCPKALGVLG